MIRTALLACALLISAPAMAQNSAGAVAAKTAAASAAEKAKSDKAKTEKLKAEKAKVDKAKVDKAKTDKAKSEKGKADKTKSAQTNSANDKDAKAKSAAIKNEKAKNDRTKGAADRSAKSAPASKVQSPGAPESQAAQAPAATPPASATPDERAPVAEVDAGKSTARSAAAQVARDIAVKNWKPVNVPRPPVLDKTLRIAAAKADIERGAKPVAPQAQPAQAKAAQAKAGDAKQPAADAARAATAAAIAQAPSPPQPRATGIFALLTQGNPDPSASQQDSGAVVRVPSAASAFARPEGPATRVARLTPLTNPLRPKATPDTKDDDLEDEEEDAPVPGGLRKQVASVQTDCIQPQLLTMVQKAAEHFGGEAIITSGFRARGRRGSYHRRCAAVDFQITGVASSQLVAYLRKTPGAGGVGTYCHTKSVHLDTGTPRDWHQCAFHRRFALRSPVGE